MVARRPLLCAVLVCLSQIAFAGLVGPAPARADRPAEVTDLSVTQLTPTSDLFTSHDFDTRIAYAPALATLHPSFLRPDRESRSLDTILQVASRPDRSSRSFLDARLQFAPADPAPVPEPATVALLATGLAAIGLKKFRRA